MKPSLALNMIVRNEAARINRCLSSVLPYVKNVVILDTGSTDGTPALIYAACDAAGVPCTVATSSFVNFSQARNEAFALAKVNNLPDAWCQFALLMDADMELVVDDPAAFHALGANALSYDMMQKAGTISYANRRIVNMSCPKDPYVGVTHEYIDVPSDGMISGAHFIDHADGSNRKDKYARDIRLLTEALADDPGNARYWYYLANSYMDAGDFKKAVAAYDKRIEIGGWDEEVHSAVMKRASCYNDLGEPDKFVAGMIGAYSFRPQRAEPLYDLARYYREKGNTTAALLFAKAGLNIKRPNDLLFVNDFVYSHGLRFEYSVAGFYSSSEREGAYRATNALALDPTCPAEFRRGARNNLFWYTKPLKEHCPGLSQHRIEFEPPAGFTAMNPSIVEGDPPLCNIRCVNYTINERGQYMIGDKGCQDAPIDTRNFILRMDGSGLAKEVIWIRSPAKFPLVTGLEDIRLYRHGNNSLYFSATVREISEGGYCQIVRGRLIESDDTYFVSDFKVLSEEGAYEKNWMPKPEAGKNDFIYRLDTIVHTDLDRADPGRVATVNPIELYVNDISGSSQLVPYHDGWIAVVHEATLGPDSKRTYWHRFALFDHDGALYKLSRPFVFQDRQIEFCTGMVVNGDNLLITFGVRDAEAWIAEVPIEEVSNMIWVP